MAKAEISGISPFFIVRDVPTALAFYRDRLGFTRLRSAATAVGGGEGGGALHRRSSCQSWLRPGKLAGGQIGCAPDFTFGEI